MACFICFDTRKHEKKPLNLRNGGASCAAASSPSSSTSSSHQKLSTEDGKSKVIDATNSSNQTNKQHIAAQTFTLRELVAATKNFRPDCLIGEGGFGRVYKGRLESTGQIVAIKQLDRSGLQGNREFLVEVLMLSLLHHPNLVNLIGYCADGDQRLLVYEYMALGCLEDHLHYLPLDRESLDWNIRMKIAAGAARGLEYLHDKANPPVIYRDFKSSNILLSEGFHPKLSDFGLAKLGPIGDKTHVSTRVMGTYGYCAPEYAMTGQLTVKSDVYSFGVVLLELVTGRKAIDSSRGPGEHNLVSWARPLFKDRKKFHQMADPLLQGCYPLRGLYQAISVAAMCLQEDAATRPMIADVVTALNYLASQNYDPRVHPINKFSPSPSRDKKSPSPSRDKKDKERKLSNGGEERGFVERMFRQGGARSNSNSPDNRDRLMKLAAGVRYSPDNRVAIRNAGVRHSPDNHGKDGGMPKSPSRMAGSHGSAVEEGRKNDMEEWIKSNGQKGSPGPSSHHHHGGSSRTPKCGSDREKAVAEAKIWGENWRERKRGHL